MKFIAVGLAAIAAVLAIVWLSARDLAGHELLPEATYTEHDGTTWTFPTDANTPFTSTPPHWKYTAPPEWVTTTDPRWDN